MLVDHIEINDIEAVRYICKWNPEQLNTIQKFTSVEPIYSFVETEEFRLSLPRPEIKAVANQDLEHLPDRFPGTYQLVTQATTPLQLAVERNRVAVVKILLEAGANPSLRGKDGSLPVHDAVRKGSYEVVTHLLEVSNCVNMPETPGGTTPLHIAAAEGHEEIAKLLIAQGAGVNKPDQTGRVPLHLTASDRGCNSGVAIILLQAGARADVPDENGKNPLHVAAQIGCPSLASLLLSNGVPVNAYTNNSQTALDLALQVVIDGRGMTKGKKACAAILVGNGGKRWYQLAPEPELIGRVQGIGTGTIRVGGGHPEPTILLRAVFFPNKEHPHFESARKALQQMVGGRLVRVVRDREMPHFGDVYLGKRWINKELIAEGHAWYYSLLFPGIEQLLKAQTKARNSQKGLWEHENDLPEWQKHQLKDELDSDGDQ